LVALLKLCRWWGRSGRPSSQASVHGHDHTTIQANTILGVRRKAQLEPLIRHPYAQLADARAPPLRCHLIILPPLTYPRHHRHHRPQRLHPSSTPAHRLESPQHPPSDSGEEGGGGTLFSAAAAGPFFSITHRHTEPPRYHLAAMVLLTVTRADKDPAQFMVSLCVRARIAGVLPSILKQVTPLTTSLALTHTNRSERRRRWGNYFSIHAHETPGVLALKDQDTVRRDGGERLIPNIMIYSHLPFYLSPPHRLKRLQWCF